MTTERACQSSCPSDRVTRTSPSTRSRISARSCCDISVRSTPAADSLDLAHWWSHPLAARKVAEEWTKLAWYLVQGAYW